VKLLIAQGFGIGRVPFAPGTFGSLIGFLWFILLLASANLILFIGGLMAGVAFSVWLCGAAELELKQTDPPSVVLDEIVAIPVCFASWIGICYSKTGMLPAPGYFVSRHHWFLSLGILALFRLFDIWKPWPVRQSQSLLGGWGVTVDDVLASLYVAALVLMIGIWHG
jgi:phosphatidylglycerophosphatase A